MRNTARKKVIIIGCGNLAWHIASRLRELGGFDLEVYNHKASETLNGFKSKFRAKIKVGLKEISADGHYYFICVSDTAIGSVAKHLTLRNPNSLLVHTSGSVAISELGERVHGCGVFYPLQTFSKSDTINWESLPIIIEGSDAATTKKIDRLAHLFSDQVIALSYRQRLKLHLTAVLVNNFSNALYAAAENLLRKEKPGKEIDFELLRPLIEQTTRKLDHLSPLAAQTGPARRNDKSVMEKHKQLLTKDPDLLKVYKMMSKLILKQQRSLHA